MIRKVLGESCAFTKSALTNEFISMFTGEKREKRARQGGRAKSPQGYPTIPRGLFASPTKHGDAYRASQRKDTYELISKGSFSNDDNQRAPHQKDKKLPDGFFPLDIDPSCP